MAAVEVLVSTLMELQGLPGDTPCVRLRNSILADPLVPEWESALCHFTELKCLYIECPSLVSLPEILGRLSSLSSLQKLFLAGCESLTSLPDSLGELRSLQVLGLSGCSSLASLPDSLGQLTSLKELDLEGCCCLPRLPEYQDVSSSLVASSLVLVMNWIVARLPESLGSRSPVAGLVVERLRTVAQPLHAWSGARKVKYILRIQTQRQAVLKLAKQQEPMLTTLERMSWLVVLLATATFIAFLQPPGGYADDSKGQVWVGNFTSCGGAANGMSETRSCAMFLFFVFDSLSFGLSMGCVIMIVVLSMPRTPYSKDEVEAGRFWLLLFITWLLLYLAVVTGVGAFAASGVAVYNKMQVVLAPLAPGMALLFVGLVSFVRRFRSLFPGWTAVYHGYDSLLYSDGPLRPVVDDEPLSQGFFLSDEFWDRAENAMRASRREVVVQVRNG